MHLSFTKLASDAVSGIAFKMKCFAENIDNPLVIVVSPDNCPLTVTPVEVAQFVLSFSTLGNRCGDPVRISTFVHFDFLTLHSCVPVMQKHL